MIVKNEWFSKRVYQEDLAGELEHLQDQGWNLYQIFHHDACRGDESFVILVYK